VLTKTIKLKASNTSNGLRLSYSKKDFDLVYPGIRDLGNIGADIAPEVRERAEEVAVAAVIVGQIAQISTITATIGRIG